MSLRLSAADSATPEQRMAQEAAELDRLDARQDEVLSQLDELDRRISFALAEWKREFVLVMPVAAAAHAPSDGEALPRAA